ncbi:MAG TPA: alpha/beta fold hydrolase [Thermoanaerobaculia bacterium]|nr:alpha/beta fold hydrolase [Thermoanaerobaculia bacterium]
MRFFALLLLLATGVSADPVEEVRQAEIAFAKAFADRDAARFFSFVAGDATFLSAGRTLYGREEVVKVWSGFFKDPVAPFSWGPERVVVSDDGTLGLSTGSIYDAQGLPAGSYISTWRRDAGGAWKVVFDGPGAPPPAVAESAPNVEEGFITTPDGARLHYRRIGRAPQTLIVPLGFILFDHVRQLSDVATVITYDMRNRGRSSRVEATETLTIHQDIQDLETVRRHFGIDRFAAIGYSYLGAMVAMYAMEHPQHVTRLVQIGAVPPEYGKEYPEGLAEPQQTMGLPDDLRKRYMEMREDADRDPRVFCELQAEVFSYLLVGNRENRGRVKSNCALENEWPANFARHLESHWASVKKLQLTDQDMKKVTMPVLTIHGTRDRNAPYGAGREWALRLPDARLVTVRGAAHSVHLEDPVTVWGAVRQFLRGEWPLGAEKVTSLVP